MGLPNEYIKQCAEAVELQDMVVPKWSLVYSKSCKKIGLLLEDERHTGYGMTLYFKRGSTIPTVVTTGKFVWLPTQEQLQGMIGKAIFATTLQLAKGFYYWYDNQRDDLELLIAYDIRLWSMQQLWLAYAMRILYKKDWCGDYWE